MVCFLGRIGSCFGVRSSDWGPPSSTQRSWVIRHEQQAGTRQPARARGGPGQGIPVLQARPEPGAIPAAAVQLILAQVGALQVGVPEQRRRSGGDAGRPGTAAAHGPRRSRCMPAMVTAAEHCVAHSAQFTSCNEPCMHACTYKL